MIRSEIRTALRTMIGNPTTTDVSDATLNEVINHSYREVVTKYPFLAARVQANFNTVDGTRGYNLNSSAKVLRRVWDSTNKKLLTPRGEEYFATNESQTTKGKPTDFVHLADTIQLFPTPDGIYTIKYIYKTTVTDLSADGESPIISPTWHRAIVYKGRELWYGDYVPNPALWQQAVVMFKAHVADLPTEIDEEKAVSEFGVEIVPLASSTPRQDFDTSL